MNKSKQYKRSEWIMIFVFLLMAAGGVAQTASAMSNNIITYQDNFENLLFNNRTNLTIATYEGGGQLTHPDVYYNSSGWNGYKYWMVFTPLPNGNSAFENPSIVASNDGTSWVVPVGLVNPIDPNPGGIAYNSDPTITFYNNKLYVYYREDNGTYDIIHMRNSTDGITWSSESNVSELPNYQLISPKVIYRGDLNKWFMWSVDTGVLGSTATSSTVLLRNSTDGITWGNYQNVSYTLPGSRFVWHQHVEWVPELNEYWMLITAKQNPLQLYWGNSTDGIHFTMIQDRVLDPGSNYGASWDRTNLYKSTIKYIDGSVKMWYGGLNGSVYAIGYINTSISELEQLSHWQPNLVTEYAGYFNRSSEQAYSGLYSAKMNLSKNGSQTLNINRNITSLNSANNTYSIWFYDDLSTGALKYFRVRSRSEQIFGLGVWTDKSVDNYTWHAKNITYKNSTIPRTLGWHKFELTNYSNSSISASIDNNFVVMILNDQFDNVTGIQLSSYKYNDSFYVDGLNVSYNNSLNDYYIYKGTPTLTNYINKSGLIQYNRDRVLGVDYVVNANIIPSSDSVNVTVSTWNTSGDYHKVITVNSSTHINPTTFTIGDSPINTQIRVTVNGVTSDFISNSSGYIQFNYSVDTSPTVFTITLLPLPTNTQSGRSSGLLAAAAIFLAVVVLLSIFPLPEAIRDNLNIVFAVVAILFIIAIFITS